jgi:chemotaxis signal transduction protein
VDAVSEVLRLSQDAIDPPSRLVASADTECITGIGTSPTQPPQHRPGRRGNGDGAAGQHRLIILLDVYKPLTSGPQTRRS